MQWFLMNNYRVPSCPDSAFVCVREAIQMKVSFISHNEIGKKDIVIVGDLQKSPSKTETRMCISAIRTAADIAPVQEDIVRSPKKPVGRQSNELQISETSLRRIMRKTLDAIHTKCKLCRNCYPLMCIVVSVFLSDFWRSPTMTVTFLPISL
jgi:hypothetical protein